MLWCYYTCYSYNNKCLRTPIISRILSLSIIPFSVPNIKIKWICRPQAPKTEQPRRKLIKCSAQATPRRYLRASPATCPEQCVGEQSCRAQRSRQGIGWTHGPLGPECPQSDSLAWENRGRNDRRGADGDLNVSCKDIERRKTQKANMNIRGLPRSTTSNGSSWNSSKRMPETLSWAEIFVGL